MARKQHLINVHTSTGTTAPTGASLYLGEIAVQHTPNEPALWIKVGSAETSTEYEKFIGLTEITNIVNMSQILGSGYTYSGLPYINSATTVPAAYSALTSELLKDEKTVAAALNNLNDRVNELSGNSVGEELVEYVQENEEVVAGALNDLNERVGTLETHMNGEYVLLTGYELASGLTEEELSLTEEDTVNEAFGKLQKQMLDNEESIAAGFNDLNERLENVDEIISHNTGITQLSGAVQSLSTNVNRLSTDVNSLSAGTVSEFNSVWNEVHQKAWSSDVSNLATNVNRLSGATSALSASVMSISARTNGVLTLNLNGVEQGKYCPSASTTINLEAIQEVTGADVLLTGYELASGTTEEQLAILPSDTVNEAFGKIQKQNYDNEELIANALNDLDERIGVLEADSGLSEMVSALTVNLDTLSGVVEDNEYITAQALINLNDRIGAIEGDSGLTTLSASVVTNKDNVTALSASVVDNKNEISAVTGDLNILSGAVESIDYVVAQSLNNLNDRALPNVSASDEGKILIVSGGTWTLISLTTLLTGNN